MNKLFVLLLCLASVAQAQTIVPLATPGITQISPLWCGGAALHVYAGELDGAIITGTVKKTTRCASGGRGGATRTTIEYRTVTWNYQGQLLGLAAWDNVLRDDPNTDDAGNTTSSALVPGACNYGGRSACYRAFLIKP